MAMAAAVFTSSTVFNQVVTFLRTQEVYTTYISCKLMWKKTKDLTNFDTSGIQTGRYTFLPTIRSIALYLKEINMIRFTLAFDGNIWSHMPLPEINDFLSQKPFAQLQVLEMVSIPFVVPEGRLIVPASLRTLNLRKCSVSINYYMSRAFEDINDNLHITSELVLPDTLERLDLSLTPGIISPSFKFPSSLIQLDLSRVKGIHVAELPHAITDLTICDSQLKLTSFPPRLIKLKISGSEWTPLHKIQVPATVTWLEVRRCAKVQLLLPQTPWEFLALDIGDSYVEQLTPPGVSRLRLFSDLHPFCARCYWTFGNLCTFSDLVELDLSNVFHYMQWPPNGVPIRFPGRLKRLNLAWNWLTDDTLHRMWFPDTLLRLNLRSNKIKHVACVPFPAGLEHLDLSCNPIQKF